jgi:hypothetical protein
MRGMSSMLLLSLLSLGFQGCSQGEAPPKLYPVTGTLVVGGKPLENITVQLLPVDPAGKGRPGIGKTDAEGKFTILTNGDKGANVGKFKVVLQSTTAAPRTGPISVEEATKMNGEMMERMKQSGGKYEPPKAPFPVEWASQATTPKEVEIVDKPVVINIDI